ncbi:hypothetical protein BKA66DRAFT_478287 [Pyrenochaeta sp. MPI-SDFR-AT-0127]|nr:hypothetical protein BKA66DRAFT_478287 [Pyrenochaeta sp. MPI-SDFR-AT-0127]
MADVQSQADDRPHDNMVAVIRGVLATMTIIPLVICLLRLYIRWFIVQSFGWDDIFVIPALMGVVGWHVFAITQASHGLGMHVWDLEPATLRVWLKDFYITQCIYLTVPLFVKISVILFLMRIFPQTCQRKLHVACKGLIVFLIAFTISGTLVLTFQCQPVRAAYTPGLAGSKCLSPDALFGLFMFQGVTMFVTDVVIIAMPMPILWKLKLPVKKRIAVIFLFSLGFVATIASLVRFSTLAFVKNGTDFTYTSSQAYIWLSIELSLGLVTGSLSSLRPIITWNGVGLFSSERSRYPDTGTHSKSHRNPRSNGYAQHDSQRGIELSAPKDRRIIKATIVDMEFGAGESTEHIITTTNTPVH